MCRRNSISAPIHYFEINPFRSNDLILGLISCEKIYISQKNGDPDKRSLFWNRSYSTKTRDSETHTLFENLPFKKMSFCRILRQRTPNYMTSHECRFCTTDPIKARCAWKGRSTGCYLKVILFSEELQIFPEYHIFDVRRLGKRCRFFQNTTLLTCAQ